MIDVATGDITANITELVWIIYLLFATFILKMNAMASKLKILRELNDYTQDFVGEDVLGISQNTYSRLEKHPENLTAEQAQKLAELYNVSISDLLSDAAPVITFKENDIKSENATNGVNGYLENQTNPPSQGEVASLKAEVEYLRKQNMELLKLIGVHTDKKDNDQ